MKIRSWEHAWLALCALVVVVIFADAVVGYLSEAMMLADARDSIATAFENPACTAMVTAPIAEVPRPAELGAEHPCAPVAMDRHFRHWRGKPATIAAELRAESAFTVRRLADYLRGAIEKLPIAFACLGVLYGAGFAFARLLRSSRRTSA